MITKTYKLTHESHGFMYSYGEEGNVVLSNNPFFIKGGVCVMLPELDTTEQLAKKEIEAYNSLMGEQGWNVLQASVENQEWFKRGYKRGAANKFTTDDIEKIISVVAESVPTLKRLSTSQADDFGRVHSEVSNLIWKQLKAKPTAVEIEMWHALKDVLEGNEFVPREAGLVPAVDENRFAKVVKWIFE